MQGAPGVGFNLTADGNYDMVSKKLTNVGTPPSNADAATEKYVDENSGGGTSSNLTIDLDIDKNDTYHILNLPIPTDADEPATKQYAVSHFLIRDGSHPMKGDVDMNNNHIRNLPNPTGMTQPTTLGYIHSNYLGIHGQQKMLGNLNMNNNRIFNLPLPNGPQQPTTLAFTDLKYLHLDGTSRMGGDLNMNYKKIIHLLQPTSDTDAATK